MPYEWLPPAPDMAEVHLWPYRSLPKAGLVWFIGGTAAMIALPLVAVLGSPVLWGVLPFLVAAIAAIWWALARSYKDAEIIEDLILTPERVTLTRHGPRGRRQAWDANPHWVRLTLHPKGGPVPNYLTMKGEGREVELGAFLTEAERIALRAEVQARLSALR